MRKLALFVAPVAVGALVAAAPAVAGAQTQPTPEVTAFCNAANKADKAVNKVESGGKPKQKDIQAADTALGEAESTAPPDIAPTVQAIVAAVRQGFQSGQDPFESDPSLQQTFNQLQQYRYNSCGYQQLDVTGVEYEFQGLPKTVPAGNVAIKFTDNGAELHELDVVRVKGKDSAKKLAGLSQKELAKKAEEVGGAFAQQGQTSYTIVDLTKPGRYAVLCHLPVGSTSEQAAEQAGKEHAKTHAQQGMYADLTVEKGATASSTATSAP
jgi:hypothetical protein